MHDFFFIYLKKLFCKKIIVEIIFQVNHTSLYFILWVEISIKFLSGSSLSLFLFFQYKKYLDFGEIKSGEILHKKIKN